MSTDKPYFKPGGSHVLFEHFDTETVMINLKSGFYFSMNPGGQRIWGLLQQWPTLEEVLSAVSSRDNGKTLRTQVTAFLEKLVEHGLVEMTAERPPGGGVPECDAATGYEPPEVQVFTDQQELLLLDPIHEVDEPGWPTPSRG